MSDLPHRLDCLAELLVETTHFSQYAGLVYEASAEIARLLDVNERICDDNSTIRAELSKQLDAKGQTPCSPPPK